MSDDEVFLRTIISDPDNDWPRLVYADYLDEQGSCDRAEFIRVQCEMAAMPEECERTFCDGSLVVCPDCRRYKNLSKRSRQLLADDGPPVLGHRTRIRNGKEETQAYRWMGAALVAGWCEWKRGFVESIEIHVNDFDKHAAEIFRQHPIGKVTLSGVTPTESHWEGRPLFIFDYFYLPRRVRHYLINDGDGGFVLGYATRERALEALSEACVAWGRELAGLVNEASEELACGPSSLQTGMEPP